MNGTSLASFKFAASSSSKQRLALILSFKTDSLYWFFLQMKIRQQIKK